MRSALSSVATGRSGTLLYDGDCGICSATARWLASRTRPAVLRLEPLTRADQLEGLRDLVTGRDLRSSIHFVRDDGRVLTGARAVLAAGRLVPRWRWLAIGADHRLGVALLEPLYRLIATHRHRIGRALGLSDACANPTAGSS